MKKYAQNFLMSTIKWLLEINAAMYRNIVAAMKGKRRSAVGDGWVGNLRKQFQEAAIE
jgi:hypothetical protein